MTLATVLLDTKGKGALTQVCCATTPEFGSKMKSKNEHKLLLHCNSYNTCSTSTCFYAR